VSRRVPEIGPLLSWSRCIPLMERRKKERRAGLFFVEGYISVQPSVLSAAIKLSERGYGVDLFYVRPQVPVPAPRVPHSIRLVEYVPYRPNFTKSIRNWSRRLKALSSDNAQTTVSRKSTESFVRIWARSLVRNSEAIQNISEIVGFGIFCRRQIKHIDLAIAFDMTGLAAMAIAVPGRVPFIYWRWKLRFFLRGEIRWPLS
jgi:hypothetical protein